MPQVKIPCGLPRGFLLYQKRMRHPIDDLLAIPLLHQLSSVPDRIDFLTHYFLGKPYLSNPQGEGAESVFDQAPLFRLDGFDCVTFVNNVLALALSHNASEFHHNIVRLNYYNSTPTFDNRFHFISSDWNPQNQKNNIIRDATHEILDENNQCIAVIAEGELDKPNWFLKKSCHETAARAEILKQCAAKFQKEYVRVPYLPLSRLFDRTHQENLFLFDQIPSPSVIEIVRPNWNLYDKIGTNLQVSHMGFSIRTSSGAIVLRHASSEQQCVVEVLLSEYLKHYLDSPTIKGINVQSICHPK
jgi:hypothetical protein